MRFAAAMDGCATCGKRHDKEEQLTDAGVDAD